MPEITLTSRLKGSEDHPAIKAPECTYTTTYSRAVASPNKHGEQDEPAPTEWHSIWVTVQNRSDGDLGAIEEAQYAVADDEVLIADLDGRTMGARRLGPDDDPAIVAKRFLQARVPKRSAKLVFPNMGVA